MSAADDGGMDAQHPEAVEVFRCDFAADCDINHDRWPDHWSRRKGPEYPVYLNIGIHADPPPAEQHMLRVELDGGAAAVFTPPIEVSPLFSYVVETSIRTSGLTHDVAYVSIQFLDAERQPLKRPEKSLRIGRTQPWTRITLGPISPEESRARYAVVGLHVVPGRSGFDLTGTADFSGLRVARLPRMVLSSSSQHNVYTAVDDLKITCQLSGIIEKNPNIDLELLDLSGRVIAKERLTIDGQPVTHGMKEKLSAGYLASEAEVLGYQGSVTWRPPIKEYGYYRVQAWMEGQGGQLHRRSLSLVLARPQTNTRYGEFGWSMPEGDHPLSLAALPGLLSEAGIHWVKFPLWYHERDHARADELAQFTERLTTHHIEMVGLLDQPPPELRSSFGEGQERLPAAAIFAEPELWFPALNPVYTRMSLKVRWWQLGRDDDFSFHGSRDFMQRLANVKGRFERYGQRIHLGVPWRWLNDLPQTENPPWEFLSLAADPSLTGDELTLYLQGVDEGAALSAPGSSSPLAESNAPPQQEAATPRAKRWLVLEPLSAEHYSLDVRARDLATRMLAAKLGGADAAFVPRPFDADTGLMNPDGTPGELFLPWRTMALALTGSDYLGQIVLPGGSRNYIFTRGDETLMVIWNDQSTEEVINLGDPAQIEHVDLFGAVRRPAAQEHRQVYQIGSLPTLITGISRELALWRINFTVVDQQLETVYARPQYPSFRLRNSFRQGVGGEMRVETPAIWGKTPLPVRLKLAGGEETTNQFEIILRSDASSGVQRVRFDFDIVADRPWQFSVWREMEVGRGDVVMTLNTRLDDEGNMIVEQRLTNETDEEVNFKCLLFAPGRRRMRVNVLNLKNGTNSQIYILPEGEDLVGKMLWVRAEEIYGQRVLNFRVQAEP